MSDTRGLPKKPAFLAAYVATASVTKAAAAARIDRALHYRWLADDPQYALDYAAAQAQAAQLLEDEAVRRANEGIEEPVVYQGGLCYGPDQYQVDANGRPTAVLKRNAKPLVIRKYSDGLLQFLLKGFLPAKYAHKTVEISGPAGGPIHLENESLQKLTDDELASLIALAQKLQPNESA